MKRVPTAKELKTIQAHAGELNWLATRTRADIAYFTSVIASASTRYPDWALALCKKVLRYLLGTAESGLRFREGGDERALLCWSDAGYGGEGTRAQSGVLVAWAGGVVLWRSSKQHNSALSTCEAEVGAGALSFQIVEGLRCLLQEWGVRLNPPVLLVDNKSAIVLTESGGSWRTRYFAVRAARLGEEHRKGTISLRYCPTGDMGSDALTKMATALFLDKLRDAMNGRLPPVTPPTQDLQETDYTWWAAMVVAYVRPRRTKKKVTTSASTGPSRRSDPAGDGPSSASQLVAGSERRTVDKEPLVKILVEADSRSGNGPPASRRHGIGASTSSRPDVQTPDKHQREVLAVRGGPHRERVPLDEQTADDGDGVDVNGQSKRKRKRGQAKKLTGNQRRNRTWRMLDDALDAAGQSAGSGANPAMESNPLELYDDEEPDWD